MRAQRDNPNAVQKAFARSMERAKEIDFTAPQDESTATEDARAFKRVAHELRIRFPVEIQYNSEFEAMVKRLEMGRL